METKTSIKDIFCPECGESLIFPNPKREIKIGKEVKKTIFLRKYKGEIKDGIQIKKRMFLNDLGTNLGDPFDRVLFFIIVASNNRSGFLELSLTPGDYSKYSSIELYPEEEIIFVCPHCHKAINKDGFVKLLVEKESSNLVEHFIVPKNGIEVTILKEGKDVFTKYSGKVFESAAEYLEKKWEEIMSRKK